MKKWYTPGFILICLTLVILSTGCSSKPGVSKKEQMQIKNIFLPTENPEGTVEFELYFLGGEENNKITAEERAVKRDELLANVLLNELIKGPAIKSTLKPLLPQSTKVLSFSLRDNVGYVNFEGKSIKSLKVDETQEKAIVEGIVKTLCQLPEINSVQIIIDNEKRETFAGNVDISKALSPGDFAVTIPEANN